MAGYRGIEGERRVPAQALHRFIARLFAAAGLPRQHARLMADIIVHTDARGVYSHGSASVAGYVEDLLSNRTNPAGRPRVVARRGGTIIVDGDCAIGHIAAAYGMRAAVRRAKSTGVALAAVRNSNHCGALSYYPTIAMAEGMIGVATTNGLPTMAPWKGVDRILGVNPIAVGLPGDKDIPILLDISFGTVARRKINIYAQKGLPLPDGWAFDAEGRPTTDPAAALRGLNQPIGGPKGVGLALVVGAVTALLTKADYGSDLGRLERGPTPCRNGHLMLAISVDSFEERLVFSQRVDRIVRQIRESKPMAGVERVLVPGELEFETETRYRSEGIPVSEATLTSLSKVGAKVGVDAKWLH